jgi:TonB family protein
MNARGFAVVLAGLCSGLVARGQTGPTQQEIEAKLRGPFVLLRGMYDGQQLNFDAQGNLIGQADVLPFSLSAVVAEQIRVTDTQIEIVGSRAGLELKPGSDAGAPESVTGVSLGKGKHNKVVVSIARDPQHPEWLEAAVGKVFAVGLDDELMTTVPDYWQPWLRHQLHPDEPQRPYPGVSLEAPQGGKVIPGVVSPPSVIYDPNPSFSPDARQKKFSGTCVIGLIVDASGNPQEVRIVRALGLGLDERAVDTVRRYKFKPAEYKGQPVAVVINLEVNFKIW